MRGETSSQWESVMPARTDRFPAAVLARLISRRSRIVRDSPEVAPQQRATAELGKLIRKLRWIGMEEDAKRLEIALAGAASTRAVLH